MELWNNKNAVIRDLERVSRGRLKVDIDPCLTAGKPVACFGEEETEEEFYRRHCSGDANFDGPDLDSIRNLLFMVKGDEDIHVPIQSNGPLQVSKLNIKAAEFIPTNATSKSKPNPKVYPKTIEEIPKTINDIPKNIPKEGVKKPPKGKRGNVAITSILARQLELVKKESIEEKKLFKPEDFSVLLPKKETAQSTETNEQPKTNINDLELRELPKKEVIPILKAATANTARFNVLETNTKTRTPKTNDQIPLKENDEKPSKEQNGFTYPMFSSPCSMFRRKSPKTSPQEIVEKETVQTPEVPKARKGGYVPSPYADQCYKKFVQNSEMRKAVTEDIWSRTMNQMKEIEEKRKIADEWKEKEKLEKLENDKLNLSKNSESASDDAGSYENLFQYLPGCEFVDSATPKSSDASTYTCASTLDISGFPDSIQLPQHRHLLTGDCVVCKAEERAAQPKLSLNSKTTSETSVNLIEFSENSSIASTSVEFLLDLE